jgi:hypothetical protein
MRNIVIIMIVAAVLIGGYVGVSKIRAPLTLLEGQTVRVHRGDLVVPINANGNIKPASITQVKSKASGPYSYSSRPNCVEAGTSVIWGGAQ